MKSSPLPLSYYQHEDVVFLGEDLLGKVLCTSIGGFLTAGIITETESYKAPEDRASHAYQMRRTKRNEVMFREGGYSYVYLCYGIHYLFNIVTGPKEVPHAVLIRSIHPLEGIDVMQRRRNKIFNKDTAVSDFTTGHFTTGPGRVTQALGIDLSLYGEPLSSQKIWIEDRGYTVKHVRKLPRVGIDYAKEWAKKPWRFLMGGLQEILF